MRVWLLLKGEPERLPSMMVCGDRELLVGNRPGVVSKIGPQSHGIDRGTSSRDLIQRGGRVWRGDRTTH